MFKFNHSKYNPRGGAYFRGEGLLLEGVSPFKSWFLNAPGLIHGGAYYRNFTPVCQKIYFATESSTVESRDNYTVKK